MTLRSLLLRPAGHERRLVSEVLVDYFLLGSGGDPEKVFGSREFERGVPLSATVAAAPLADTIEGPTTLDDLSAASSGLGLDWPAYIVVIGAGLSVVDGFYQKSPNQFNNRPAYNNAVTTTDILWRGDDWYLSAGGFGDAYKLGSGTDPGGAELLFPFGPPPLGEPLYPPAPNVFFISDDAQGAQGGRIVLAYPSSFPPLIASGGLTYTETAVGDKRHFTFTAGSGTITFP